MHIRRSRNSSMSFRAASVAMAMLFFASQTLATTGACTPGFWKNHESQWPTNCLADNPSLTPETLLTSVFNNIPGDLSNDTLMDALNYGGGPSLVNKKQIMLRHAVAALLNSCTEELLWCEDPAQDPGTPTCQILSPQDVIQLTSEWLLSEDQGFIIGQAESFDLVNNSQLLGCPLSGRPE